MKRFLGLAVALLCSVTAARAAHTQAALLLDHTDIKPGGIVLAAVRLKMEPNWHTYWKNPGDSGKATKIKWDLPAGISAGEIEWQVPEKTVFQDIVCYEFKDETALVVPLAVGAEVKPGTYPIKAKVDWLECQDANSCIPEKQNVEASLIVGTESKESPDGSAIRRWQAKVPHETLDVKMSARWNGPAKGDDRDIIFTVESASNEWDFFNYPLEDSQLMAKTDRLPLQNGKAAFRKKVTKFEGWPTKFIGVALIPGDEKNAGVITVPIERDDSPVMATAASATPAAPIPAQAVESKSLIAILWFAFFGGLILNIMPCVLPVISLKILGFVRQSKDDPMQIRTLGLIYSLGVIVSFLALASFVIAVKQAGHAASWGMQFQNPVFLVLITLLVTLVALNLFGVFEVTLSGNAMTAAGSLASKEGKSGAFFNGVLATILATPCTAPFLGAALGFAFVASSGIILLTFLMVGIGLAFPYLLLCWFPAWLKKLPKPGAWMEKFKMLMGFPMLATAIWLFSVALKHFPYGALNLGLFLVVVALAAWIFGEFVQRGSKRRGLAGFASTALVGLAFVYFLEFQLNWRHPVAATRNIAIEAGGIQWQPWSPAAVQQVRAKGQPVLIDFTADWCLTCQANKKTSIEIPSVREKIKALNVAPFLADNTLENPEIAAELQKYKRAGVPLVLVLPADPNAPAIVLPELLTPSLVLDALEKASAAKSVATTK